MRTWKKIAIGGGVAVLVAAGVSISVYESRKNIVTVQTARAKRLDLVSIVSASGEIKPKTYVNIGANAFGKITKLYVKDFFFQAEDGIRDLIVTGVQTCALPI